eukprot:7746245-Alexandrium_andersonii.AAC.1
MLNATQNDELNVVVDVVGPPDIAAVIEGARDLWMSCFGATRGSGHREKRFDAGSTKKKKTQPRSVVLRVCMLRDWRPTVRSLGRIASVTAATRCAGPCKCALRLPVST